MKKIILHVLVFRDSLTVGLFWNKKEKLGYYELINLDTAGLIKFRPDPTESFDLKFK